LIIIITSSKHNAGLVHCYNNDNDNKTMTTTLTATTMLIADSTINLIWLYVEIWLFLPQGRRATIPAASLWLVRQHGTLCQHCCMSTHWHRHLSVINWRLFSLAQLTPHQHACDCYLLLLEWADITTAY